MATQSMQGLEMEDHANIEVMDILSNMAGSVFASKAAEDYMALVWQLMAMQVSSATPDIEQHQADEHAVSKQTPGNRPPNALASAEPTSIPQASAIS